MEDYIDENKNTEITEEITELRNFFKQLESPLIILNKGKELKDVIINNKYHLFKDDFSKLKYHISILELKYNREKKEVCKQKEKGSRYYQSILKEITENENFIDYMNLQEQYLCDETIVTIYTLIHYNLSKSILFLERENEKLRSIHSNKRLEKLFSSFEIPISFFKKSEISLLKELGDLNKIEEFLSALKKGNIDLSKFSSNHLTLFLLTTTNEEMNVILNLITNKILTYDVIKNNIEIFFNKENILFQKYKTLCNTKPMYQIILKNISFHKKINTNFYDKNYNSNSLLQENYITETNYHLFQFYQEYINTEINNPCLFLTNKDLFSLIDTLLEISINPKDIDFSTIHSPIPLIQKRIILAHKIGIPVLTENNQINPILESGDNFYIDNKELEEIIPTSLTINEEEAIETMVTESISYIHPIIQLFDEKFLSPNNDTYNFNGTYISKKKIIYLLTSTKEINEEILLSIILYKTHLKDDERKNIYNCMDCLKNKVKSF